MALIVRPHRRALHAEALDAMHHLRWQVFVEGLGWRLQASDGEREIDEFDRSGCSYLLQFGEDGRLHASLRLTPSLQPNVSCDVLGPELGCVFPRDSAVVEISRECYAPALPRERRFLAARRLYASLRELFVKEGWSASIGVAYERRVQLWIRSGAHVQILAGPVVFPGDREASFAVRWSPGARPLPHLDHAPSLGRLQDPDDGLDQAGSVREREIA